MSIYTNNGFKNREEYLDSLREVYGGLVDIFMDILPALVILMVLLSVAWMLLWILEKLI